MGICDGLEGSASADCSVGTIVWVRRRNGSWWPGRILGPNELSASHLMSPRSGTPVKLLGREDASVDWYNLEKSKRVKAFRCGEFDDCIERAESSQGIPIKKREKYARREDAILHALELEKQQLEKKQLKSGIGSNCMSNKMSGTLRKELDSCSPLENNLANDEARDRFKFRNIKSQLLSKSQDSTLKEESMDNPLYAQKGKHVKQPSWEDENAEAIPRMRGLQDFGLRIASSKKKNSTSIGSGSPQKPFSIDNHVHVLPSSGRSLNGANHVSSSKNSLAIKRKRSEGGLAEESLVKRRDRRRPLVQVLQSSAKLPVSLPSDGDPMSISVQGEKDQMGVICRAKRSRCVYLPPESNGCLDHAGFPSEQMQIMPSHFGMDNGLLHPSSLLEENTSSGLIEATESDSSERDYLDPDMEEDTAALSDTTQVQTVLTPGSRDSGRYVSCNRSIFHIQGGNMNNEELDESALSGYMSELHTHEQTAGIAADMGSKWQSKGRRNIRNLTKRQMEAMEGNDPITPTNKCNGSVHGTFYEGQGNTTGMAGMKISDQRALKQGFYHRSEGLNYAYDKADLIERDSRPSQMVVFENRRYPLMLKAASEDRAGSDDNSTTDSDDDSHNISPSAWEADELSSQAPLRGYWDDPDECYDPIYGHHGDVMEESMLVDVDLKVQMMYQKGEHVPLVSLMSRLNGKAIIGHPIQIETLEDGSSDLLLSTGDLFEEPADNDGNTAVQPVWRTARRTAMHRVPRPRPSSALEGDEADPRRYSDLKCKPLYKKSLAGPSDHKARLMRKNFSHIPRKPPKKVSFSSQKTRTLSSIAIEQKPGGGKDSESKSSTKVPNLDGAITIKPEEAALSSVTCIPLKLVFSRILEGVGRPPSSRAVGPNGVSVPSDAEKKPS